MGPSALSAGIFESGMYDLVLCRIQKFPLSRIWTHIVRLEEIQRAYLGPSCRAESLRGWKSIEAFCPLGGRDGLHFG